MKKIGFLFFLALAFHGHGQIVFDFESDSLTQWTQYPYGRWEISSTDPLSGEASLWHAYDHSSDSRDRISFPASFSLASNPTTWRCQVRYDYNPSGGNHWGYLLLADTSAEAMHPSGLVNGYLLGVNYNTSDDLLKIWKLISGSGYECVTTSFNWQNEIDPGTVVGLQVENDGEGNWKVYVDKNGGFDELRLAGSGTDNEYTDSRHAGFYYQYTSSADQKLWFDDVYIGPPVADTISPRVLNTMARTSRTVYLVFSEGMDSTSLLEPTNFMLNGSTHPVVAERGDPHNTSVLLTFSDSFSDGSLLHLEVKGLRDEDSNFLADTLLVIPYERMKAMTARLLSPFQIQVQFNKIPDSCSVLDNGNYSIDAGIGSPHEIHWPSDTSRRIELILDTSLSPGIFYQLHIRDIGNIYGDTLVPVDFALTYNEAEQNDIVINEMMVDPVPSAGLPEYEYIELWNRSDKELSLSNWTLRINDHTEIFGNVTIPPKEFLLLCDEEALESLNDFGNVHAFSSMPPLLNTEGKVSLLDTSDTAIDQLYYNDRWYRDPEKEHGGFSLERIDPANFCSGMLNWAASLDASGGTPGEVNSVLAINPDTIPPYIRFFEVVNPQQLHLTFSEPLESTFLNQLEAFLVDQGIGHPYSIQVNYPYNDQLDLFFASAFQRDHAYLFSAEGVADPCGNVRSIDFSFLYHPIQPYEVQINEIMADPEPSMGLPEAEYLELYNATPYPVSLNDWRLILGASDRMLGEITLQPDSFIILCDREHEEVFSHYGPVCGVENFPSLSNQGETVVLEDEHNQVIFWVDYNTDWYKNEYKKEGGWSLEQVDPGNPCGENANWKASVDSKGGTPGKTNSVKAPNLDHEKPDLLRASFLDSSSIRLHFSEPLDRTSASDEENYTVEGVGHPFDVVLNAPAFTSLTLFFPEPFSRQTRYRITVADTISDCQGNILGFNASVEFERPEIPGENDLVINEILFNPLPGGHDFVEIYNNSGNTFDLSRLCLGSGTDYHDVVCMNDYDYLIFPGDHLTLTEETASIQRDYFVENPSLLVDLDEFPSYTDQSGHVFLMDKNTTFLDQMEYHDEMHFPLVKNNDGISLERIHYELPSRKASSWHSASENSGFATPTYRNSQYSEMTGAKEQFSISPEVFSPDNDGQDDLLYIHYSFDRPGRVVNVTLYDSKGRLERNLVNNQTLGTEGSWIWDGLNENNQRSGNGIYIIYIELFDLQGNVEKIKMHCVVGGKI